MTVRPPPVVFGSMLAAACAAAPPGPVYQDPGYWGERILVEGIVLPAVWLTRDVDGGAPRQDDLDGAGYGIRIASGNRDQSVGVLYEGFDLDGFNAQTLSFDSDVRTPLDAGRGWLWFLRAGGSVGISWFDEAGNASEQSGVGQIRLGIDIQPHERFLFNMGFGGIVFGHPGETDAYGTFVTLGGALVF